MSKMIKIGTDAINAIRDEFEKALSKLPSSKLTDGKFSFTKSFNQTNRKATLYFKEMAWLKMQKLISGFDKEVAWHGVAFRGIDDTKDEYIIEDILVYPQEVTGATVTTDQEKYQSWLFQFDDEVFNNIRMQGHSHVNMATNPSGTDLASQDAILDQIEDDMFYIFLIWNKRNERTIKIYDMAKNVMFETSDVTVSILPDQTGLEEFLSEAKSMVKDPPVKTSYAYSSKYGYKKVDSDPKKAVKPADTGSKKGDDDDLYEYYKKLYGLGTEDDDPFGPFGYNENYYSR